MWRFGIGSPPSKKKKQTTEEKRAKGREYDHQKRVRNFANKWTLEFPWVKLNQTRDDETDTSTESMICTWCIQYPTLAGAHSPFIADGCKTIDHFTLKRHNESDGHKATIAKMKQVQSGESTATKTLHSLNKSQTTQLTNLFIIAHKLAVKGLPWKQFRDDVRTCSKTGANVGSSYRTEVKCREFVHYIAEETRLKLSTDLAMSGTFFSITIDESTDSSVTEDMIMFIRSSHRCVISTDFVAITALEKADADSITAAIKSTVKNYTDIEGEDLKSKLVGLSCDGAAVLMGCRRGVATQLRSEIPHLVVVHCLAHRLELCFKKVINASHFSSVTTFLMDLYNMYHRSPLNIAGLNQSCASMSQTSKRPLRPWGTRWIPHLDKALDQFWAIYAPLVQHLEQIIESDNGRKEQQNRASAMLRTIKQSLFIKNSLELHDIVKCLSLLSLSFQRKDIMVYDAIAALKRTKTMLELLRDSPDARQMSKKFQDDDGEFKGVELNQQAGRTRDKCVRADLQTTVGELLEQLDSRLQDIVSNELSASSCLDIRKWDSTTEEWSTFGNDGITILIDRFHDVLSGAGYLADNILVEWQCMKQEVKYAATDINIQSWSHVLKLCGDTCPNLIGLVDIVLCLSVTSVECERGFSVMRKTKSDWRNCLSDKALTDQMRVMLVGKDIESYDPDAAVKLWLNASTRPRRLNVKTYRKRKVSVIDDSSSASGSDESD